MNFFEQLQQTLSNPTVKVGVDNQSINAAINQANQSINRAIITVSVSLLLVSIIIVLLIKYLK